MSKHLTAGHGKLADVSNGDLVHSWRHFLERYHSTTCALERALNEEHQLGMSEFEVLERLAEWETAETCEGAAKRVQELATSLHLSQSALSRVIARLERDGLVMRGMCPNDRRGIYVCLTEEGRSRHARALPTQRSVLAAEFAAAAAAESAEQKSSASPMRPSSKPRSDAKPATKGATKPSTKTSTKARAKSRAHAVR
jgi:DNA-binding MarR family transcriptional regulator